MSQGNFVRRKNSLSEQFLRMLLFKFGTRLFPPLSFCYYLPLLSAASPHPSFGLFNTLRRIIQPRDSWDKQIRPRRHHQVNQKKKKKKRNLSSLVVLGPLCLCLYFLSFYCYLVFASVSNFIRKFTFATSQHARRRPTNAPRARLPIFISVRRSLIEFLI